MKEIDVRGLSCPEPLLIVQGEISKNSNEKFKILANEAHTVKNISVFLEKLNRKYSVTEKGMDFELIVE